MLSRRVLVGRLAAGTAAVWVAGLARTGAASVRSDAGTQAGAAPDENQHSLVPGQGQEVVDSGPPTTLSAPPAWDLVRPLAAGSEVVPGWRVAELTGVVDGSCVLTLRNERGRAQRIHICRNGGEPQGLVYTDRFDLVVMNGGQGDLPTEEGFAQAVAEVAHVLATNERDRQKEPLVTALLPHGERVRMFSGPVDRRLR